MNQAVQAWQQSLQPRDERRHLLSTVGQCRSDRLPQCVVCQAYRARLTVQTVDPEDVIAAMDAALPAVDIAVPPTIEIEKAVERLRRVGWVRQGLVDHARRNAAGLGLRGTAPPPARLWVWGWHGPWQPTPTNTLPARGVAYLEGAGGGVPSVVEDAAGAATGGTSNRGAGNGNSSWLMHRYRVPEAPRRARLGGLWRF